MGQMMKRTYRSQSDSRGTLLTVMKKIESLHLKVFSMKHGTYWIQYRYITSNGG